MKVLSGIIKFTRLVIRGILALLWTLSVHYFGIRIWQILTGKKIFTKSISVWGKGLAFIMGVRIHKINGPKYPMGDLIVSNHMGFLDVPLMLSFFPAVFIIKEEASRVFYFGKALLRHGHLFVDRKNPKSAQKTAKDLMKTLKKGTRVIVFPEGRASSGAKRLPFKTGSFSVAARLKKTVQACAIDYLPDRKMLEWDIKKPMFGQLVKLFGRRRTDISIEFFEPKLVEGDISRFVEDLHDLIQSRLEDNDRKRGKFRDGAA